MREWGDLYASCITHHSRIPGTAFAPSISAALQKEGARAMNAQAMWDLLKNTFTDWSEDKAPRLAAALAYYTVFAIAPILIIAIAIASIFFTSAQDQIIGQVSGLIGPQAGDAIKTMIQNREANNSSNLLATIIGLVTLLVAATGLFGELQDSLNTIWEVQPKPNQDILATLKNRFLSFTMVLGVGFLLLVSLVISTALSALGNALGGAPESQTIIWKVINFVISFGVVTLLFALIYKVIPDVKITWNDVWIGALATAVLFTVGKFLIARYLATESTASTYGAAGALVLLLIWVYYSAQILFLGAEFTQVYAKAYGSKIEPAENAVPVTEEARTQQGIPHEEHEEALLEREVGGNTARTPNGKPAAPSTAEPTPPQKAGAGAVTAFFLGLLLGRRQRPKR
jgi:membrane protein